MPRDSLRWRRLESEHRIGPCRPMHLGHRAIRAGLAPVRQRSRCGTHGTTINRRATRSPADAELVKRADERAQSTFAAALARAKRLDARGNRSGCKRALAEARRRYELP